MTKAIYNMCQITYCLALIDEASKLSKEHPHYLDSNMPVSKFMMDFYLGSKYQKSFNAMIDGQRHKIKWNGPDENKTELSDLLTCQQCTVEEHWGDKDIAQHKQGLLFADRHYG